jgi:serine/threonine protein kinase
VHAANILHQDIKPHNMMTGRDGNLFLVDFGLARQIPIRRHSSVRGFIGTPRYASVRAHEHLEQSKKDDLESLFYNLAFLYYRRLPWSKLSVPHDQRLDKIKRLKIRHRETLFREMGQAFERAFEYIINL